jgi:hypothetical protein
MPLKKTTALGAALQPLDTNQETLSLREARSQKRKATSPSLQEEELDQEIRDLEIIHQQVQRKKEKMARLVDLQKKIDEAAEEVRHLTQDDHDRRPQHRELHQEGSFNEDELYDDFNHGSFTFEDASPLAAELQAIPWPQSYKPPQLPMYDGHSDPKQLSARMVKENEEALKKRKSSPEPKVATSKKRRAATPEPKAAEIEEETLSTPSATEVEEILKVMTESLPIKLLSPLGPQLTKLLQKKDEPSALKKVVGPKKQRIVIVMQAIEEKPPSTSTSKMTPAIEATASAEAATAEATNLESTLSAIDKVLLDLAAKETVAAAEEALTAVPEKGKETAEDASEEKGFSFQNLVDQELSMAEKEELQEYAISCGYQPGAMLFGGINEEALGCIRDCTGAKVISTLSKSVGSPKLEADISRYRRQHIVGSLFYSNFKVVFFNLFLSFLIFL